jgi:4-diphosphocytidyl-2-C-methyl-D-erythritol kinase
MIRRARLRALAKLNLDLKVLHKRADGFHELRTVFQTISLADELDIAYTPGRRTGIHLDCAPEIPDNLALRAAKLVVDETAARGHIAISLHKRIPMGGGLGGGSSDAAAVLLALPALIGRMIALPKLVEMAASLGSDVPYFLLGGTALGLGRGTEIYPLPDFPARHALVIAPPVAVSTAEAYRALGRELTSDPGSPIINSFQCRAWEPAGKLSASGFSFCENDFEGVVFKRHPELKSLKQKLLRAGARFAMLTGSGAALFGLFETRQEAKKAASAFEDVAAFPVELISRSRYRSLWWTQLRAHVDGRVWPPPSRYAR